MCQSQGLVPFSRSVPRGPECVLPWLPQEVCLEVRDGEDVEVTVCPQVMTLN